MEERRKLLSWLLSEDEIPSSATSSISTGDTFNVLYLPVGANLGTPNNTLTTQAANSNINVGIPISTMLGESYGGSMSIQSGKNAYISTDWNERFVVGTYQTGRIKFHVFPSQTSWSKNTGYTSYVNDVILKKEDGTLMYGLYGYVKIVFDKMVTVQNVSNTNSNIFLYIDTESKYLIS